MLIINARFKTRPITGVERYAYELTRRLQGDIRYEIPSSKWRGARGHFWEQFILPTRLASNDWLFSPANTGPISVRRQIVTIHDLAPIDHPEWFSSSFSILYRLLWPVLVGRVRGILTDSAFSRERIINRLKVMPDQVSVIPTGVDMEMFHPSTTPEKEQVLKKYGLKAPFFLFVGSLQPRKNLPRLLTVWQEIQPDFPDLDLVIVGASGPQFQAFHAHQNPPPQTRFLGYVPDQDLPALYSSARGLIHPGLYEGSGLTLLEAMACGCPVAAANNTALPEIVGDAGVLFDPFSEMDMANELRKLFSDGAYTGNLRVIGLEQARKFTWERACNAFHVSLHKFQVW